MPVHVQVEIEVVKMKEKNIVYNQQTLDNKRQTVSGGIGKRLTTLFSKKENFSCNVSDGTSKHLST